MRITNSMLFNNFLANLDNINTQLYNTQTQMATGKSINNLSDNPTALSQVMSIQNIQDRFTQYTSNINYANSTLSAQDTATKDISSVLQNAGSLVVQAANATNDTASNTAIAQQLAAVESEIKNGANTMFGGNYLFSGFLTNTAPVQNITQQAVITSSNNNFQITTSKSFSDLNQLKSGAYSISIDNSGNLTIKQNGNPVPISSDGVDRSFAGGNTLSTSVNVANIINNGGGWFDTGRGVKIYIPANGSSATFNYTQGGNNVYAGDSNNLSIAYSDGLTTPITINAQDMLYQQHKILQSNNQLLNSSNNPATAQTLLTDLHLSNALGNVSLQTGQTISITGTDHDGNVVSGSGFTVSANATVSQLLNYITNLKTKEVLQNNKVLTLQDGLLATSATTLNSIVGVNSSITISLANTNSNISTTFSAGSTIANVLSFFKNQGYSATISHGLIQIQDNSTGSNNLNVSIKTQANGIPVFGLFTPISDGAGEGFNSSVVSATMDNGHIVIQDLRGGASKLNLSINVLDSNNKNSNNIFGVFNTIAQGGGINIFDSFDNAQAAVLGQSVNQISKATGFSGGSTLTPTVSGYYTGNNSDQWTFTVTSTASGGSTSSIANLSSVGNSAAITITNSSGVSLGTIDISVNSHGRFNISVLDSSGNITSTILSAANLSNIKLPDGLTLNLSKAGVTPILKDGDSFSVTLTNMLQQSITNIQNSLSQVDANRSVIGAYEQRMQLAQTRINNTSLSNSQTLSNLQDANYAQVISNYEQEITIMQALMQSFAKVNQLSLFNYI
ncbi:Flagellar hook-associated protein FlgL [Desulfurella amilsii]|uniref:Flagellar hook-associated protein FlgL n=1 Tax=Desulfurella amilsii TaxID=1562698 RepID=A0A1X4XUT5_9BACT|nr:flagellar hook-associated protein FlgL [Desulfurella amilsii]OSS41288.1 Flagellar hook-associated protein FlgL [Desulfurella amilsii]